METTFGVYCIIDYKIVLGYQRMIIDFEALIKKTIKKAEDYMYRGGIFYVNVLNVLCVYAIVHIKLILLSLKIIFFKMHPTKSSHMF